MNTMNGDFMAQFPSNLRFQYPWRPYQERILLELERYLDDSRLHIVAAPGSGKTIIGLEVILRLNKPTIIFAPTIAIKNQWVDRFVTHFIPDKQKPSWISDNIKDPRFLTVSTYQGLYSAMYLKEDHEVLGDEVKKPRKRSTRNFDVIDLLKSQNVRTIVVDEAHHLRRNWWVTLQEVIQHLSPSTIVSLTATPPYDVLPAEWERYTQLCGPADTEVSVPELVKARNLCYHQDYVLFSTPTDDESTEILRFRKKIWNLISEINHDGSLRDYLYFHPWITNPSTHIEAILEEPAFFSSMLVYLNSIEVTIPKNTLKIVNSESEDLPRISLVWLEILFTGLLYNSFPSLEDLPPFLSQIHDQLKTLGAIERRKVDLEGVEEIERILKQSLSKLKCIVEIVDLESSHLGESLRQVILTDFIRKEYLPKSPEDAVAINKIGVIPIFEEIRRYLNSDLTRTQPKLGVLTGSIIIIPRVSEFLFNQIIEDEEIPLDRITITECKHDPFYLHIRFKGADKRKRVELITRLFTEGGLNVLVGTTSLLGEGWDAPSINSLILASFVGSFMLSNQMRGRAIRIDPTTPNKTANIWHLVCLDLPSFKARIGFLPDRKAIGGDFHILQRRFNGFLGVAFDKPIISNGLERLNIKKPPITTKEIKNYNQLTKTMAVDRESMVDDWEKALRSYKGYKLVHGVRSSPASLPRFYVFTNTIAAIVWQGIMSSLFFLTLYIRGLSRVRFQGELDFLLLLVLIGILVGFLIFLPYFLKAMWLFLRHGPLKGSMNQVANALLISLCNIRKIKTPFKKITIKTEKDEIYLGAVRCYIHNCTKREESIFLDALEELLSPIENPRYLLKRRSIWGKIFKRQDYLGLPTILATNKEYSQEFGRNWAKYVGKMELIYTRTLEGRQILLQARMKSLSAGFIEKAARINSWQ
ncbi:MAG: DEAD/DEAH box helicase family protein [Candidatus Heimdallarchaeota archaeon]|nr:MAG: DEAD/DEAH box helicase family protein [Candidatus Heimdallarchaeota archaeon]